ncbi:MAG: DUF559 domain-containing protein, partial [Actinobacteria bacterium]|nr:DUF559 domain-containing protein [Actinomycetota bacterium]
SVDRVRDGVFAARPIDPDVRAAVAHGGALTCASVLATLRIWVLPEITGPHVWLGAGRHGHAHAECACVPHYYRGTPPLGRTDLETALLHLRLCSGDEAFFAAFESAWRRRLLPLAARRRIREALPASHRWLVDLARHDADSGLESLLRLRLHTIGLRLRCQVSIDGVGKVDFVVGRLIIEVDGKENHDGKTHRHKDLVRDAAAARLGYRTLRFDYAQVVHDWPSVQAAILAALRDL